MTVGADENGSHYNKNTNCVFMDEASDGTVILSVGNAEDPWMNLGAL